MTAYGKTIWGCACILAAIAALPGLAAAGEQKQKGPPVHQREHIEGMRVTLLGTGTPAIRINRFGPSTLVQAGDLNLLFDAGRGVSMRIGQLGMPIGDVDAVFLTHFHSDHTNGLPDIYLSGYVPLPLGGRQTAFQLYGPKRVDELANGLMSAYAADLMERSAAAIPKAATKIEAHVVEPGKVFEKNGVTVSAFRVPHDPSENTFGYKIAYQGHVVVISGDTSFNIKIADVARGADLLVHEVAAASDKLGDNPLFKVVLKGHTSPEDAAKVFAAAKPKAAAFTHIVLLPDAPGGPTPDDIIKRTRAAGYDGPLYAGEDLMQFDITNKGVKESMAKAAH
jgi:ribonuclease Z